MSRTASLRRPVAVSSGQAIPGFWIRSKGKKAGNTVYAWVQGTGRRLRPSVPPAPHYAACGVMSGLSVAALGLTSAFVGSCALVLALMCVIGLCNTIRAVSIQNSLQTLVPDTMLQPYHQLSLTAYRLPIPGFRDAFLRPNRSEPG